MTDKPITLGEIASLISADLDGDPDFVINDAGTIRECKPDWLTFVNDTTHLAQFEASDAVAAIVSRDLPKSSKMTLRVEDPVTAFAGIVRLFRNMMTPPVKGVHPSASVSETARLGDDITIAAGVVIGENVSIGAGTCILENTVVMDESVIGEQVIIFPNVTIYDNTQIGNRCILHAGCTLGAYGFGYDSTSEKHLLSDQLGYVLLEDEVELGANACIDRGTYSTTRIGQGTKIDNLVQIGHNCQIGKHNLICAQVGIAGSTQTGDYVVMGGQAGVADHVNIPSQTMIGAQSGVIGDLKADRYFGTPARNAMKTLREFAALAKLPDMVKRLRKLEEQLATIADSVPPSQQDAA